MKRGKSDGGKEDEFNRRTGKRDFTKESKTRNRGKVAKVWALEEGKKVSKGGSEGGREDGQGR